MRKTFITLLTALLFASGAWATSAATFNFNDNTTTGLTIVKNGSNASYALTNSTFNSIPVLDGYFFACSFTSNSSGVITITTDNSYSNISSISFNSAATNNNNPRIAVFTVDDKDVETSVQSAMKLSSGTVNTWRASSYNIDLSSSLKTGKVRFKLTTGSSNVHAALDNIVITYGATPSTAYTVTFNAGSNGTCGTASLTEASAGAGVTLPAVTPSTGYSFNGWYDAASEGTFIGAAGVVYNPTSDITLYAQYSVNTYTITLDDNGGTADGEATATYNSNKLTGISAPTYAGHSVVGYYKEAECTNLIADAAGNLQVSTDYTDGSGKWTSTSDQTLYAKWLAAISPVLSYHVTTLNPTYITTANPTLTGNTGNGMVTYESSKPAVATVDASGVVTAVAAGTTTITAHIASNNGYAAGSASCDITVLDDEVTDLYIFKKGTDYGGDGKCVSSGLANGTENATGTSATLAYSTYSVDGSTGMKRPGTAGTTVTYTFTVTQSNYAISSICTYGKLEEPAGAQYSWDGGKTWNPLSKYSESKMYFGAPAGKYPTSFIIKYVGISTTEGGLYWRNALVTMVPAPHILSLTAGKWASFCPSYNVTIPANVTAYKASINGAKDEITATAIDGGIIPAAEGVLLKATATDEYTFAKTTDPASVSGNFLKGTTERTSSSTLTGPGEYLMALLKNEDKFVQYTGSYFPANRAYFAIVPPASAPSAIRIVEEGNNATSIMNVEATDEAVKFIEDGKLFIKKNGVVYDAMGRAVR